MAAAKTGKSVKKAQTKRQAAVGKIAARTVKRDPAGAAQQAMFFYVGQVQTFGFGFAPQYWLPCDGRLLPINQNLMLYALLGTTYGGDGKTNFALPKLAPVEPDGPGYYIAIQGIIPPK